MEHTISGTHEVQLQEGLVLHPTRSMQGKARTMSDGEVVLGGTGGSADDPMPVLHQQGFSEAQPPVALRLAPPAPTGIPGMPTTQAQDQMATLSYTPDTTEPACYALVQAIHTPDGVVYDVTLPQPALDDEALPFDVLGGAAGALEFPVHRMLTDTTTPASDDDMSFDVLGGGLAATTERILHLVRAPIESNLHALIRRNEVPFRVWHVAPDGTMHGTLDDAGAWRVLFPEQRTYRVLLYIHGFTSRSERSLPRNWIQAFGGNYDVILAYDHPSITLSPLDNARELLAFIPADLSLQVDILAHSRGGLVARSIVELEPPSERLRVQRAMLVGTPNAGTEIADVDRWDRFLAMGFTTASWLAGFSDGGAITGFSVNGLGLVLRASAQLVFDLPGLEAMSPTSTFLSQLNTPNNNPQGTRYAAVTADFNPLTISQASFRESLQSLAVQIFLEAPNDLVVRTDSMISVDAPRSVLLAERILQSTVHHHAYFDDPDVLAYARSFFTG